MYKNLIRIVSIIVLFYLPHKLFAQADRIQIIQKKLDTLSRSVPGLKQKVQLQVVGTTLQTYLLGISSSNNLNVSVDPKLNFNITDSFNDATAENILLFLAQKYSLTINIVGAIIYVTQYQEPVQLAKIEPKVINAVYSAADNTLSLALNNDSLSAVAKKITLLSNKNLIVPVELQGKIINAFISKAPFEAALDKMAYSNGIKMVRTNDNFYLFQPLGDNEELYISGDKSTGVRNTFRPTNPVGTSGSTQLFIKTVNGQKLISVDASGAPIVNLVKQASQQLNKNYSIYTDLKGSIDVHVNDINYDDFLSLLFKGTNYTFQQENGVYLIGDRTIEGLRTSRTVHLQYRTIDTIVSLIPSDWKKGLEIKELREQNTILLSGSISQINEVEKFIKDLDVLVPVVLIEVTMIDFHHTRAISTGIAAGVSDSVKTGGSVLPGLDFTVSASSVNSFLSSISSFTSVNLGHVVPNFYATIRALETNNNVDIRSVPKLLTLNGHAAKLSLGSKVWYKNSTQNLYNSAANNASVFTTAYIPVEAALTIDFNPVVSGDDQVTLGINVNIADFTTLPTDGSPPSESINQFTTKLRVHSEDTILLGGIERTENDLVANGIPLLSRIPILKWIFSSRTKTSSKVTTVLFIKATILR